MQTLNLHTTRCPWNFTRAVKKLPKNLGTSQKHMKYWGICDLGNYTTKGFLHTAGPQFAQRAEEMMHDAESRFYRSREQ
jgi:hypothetical protein